MSARTPRLTDAFDPRVTAFRTDTFSLAEDLDWLDRHRGQGAAVGVILHSTRLLEVLTRGAAATAGLTLSAGRLDEALRLLSGYQYLSRETYRLLDRLRDLGNAARHVLRRMTPADADQGYAIVLRGLQWYFCEFPRGPRLACLCVHNRPLDDLLPADVATLLAVLESAELSPAGFLAGLRLGDPRAPLLASPVLAAVLAERLLTDGRSDEAQRVLTAALGHFPQDVRLRQLQGLLWSRAGRLREACDWLEAIGGTDSAADEETMGILAGAYKRRAEAESNGRDDWLRKCHGRYDRGWQRSRGSNTYLGVNAAATGLWLGLRLEAATTAGRVRDILEGRRRDLVAADPPAALHCWDQLTLAEAHLLLGEFDTAARCYRDAAERFGAQRDALRVARGQAERTLATLGRPELGATMFPG